jgi:hypothetical protein
VVPCRRPKWGQNRGLQAKPPPDSLLDNGPDQSQNMGVIPPHEVIRAILVSTGYIYTLQEAYIHNEYVCMYVVVYKIRS